MRRVLIMAVIGLCVAMVGAGSIVFLKASIESGGLSLLETMALSALVF